MAEDLVAGRYRVVRPLGRGGMAIVLEAIDEKTHRPCALKLLDPQASANEEVVARFCREVQAGATLGTHPAIVGILDAGQVPETGALYLAMELVRGKTLTERVKAGLERPAAVKIVEEVARAVSFAHEKGFIHRDLKPDNIIVDEKGQGRLTDFGLTKALSDLAGKQLTRAGEVLGTPTYMAPEQLLDAHASDERSDVYGLGAILYFVLTRRPPFQGATRDELLEAVVTGRTTRPRQVDATIPPELETLCARAMANDPKLRPATAGELADALAAWRRGGRPPSGRIRP